MGEEEILVSSKYCLSQSFSKVSFLRHYTIPTYNISGMNTFENIVGKGENAGNNVFYSTQPKFQFLSHNYLVFCK